MTPSVGHVGSRVSALIDGQLPEEVAERLWTHVHTCCSCRELVEREGWVKTRLAGLSHQQRPAPDYLQSLLTLGPAIATLPTVAEPHRSAGVQRRRTALAVVVGAGSVSAALVGVVALAGPAQTPVPVERRAPAASFPSSGIGPVQPGSTPAPGPSHAPTASLGETRNVAVGVGLADQWVTIDP